MMKDQYMELYTKLSRLQWLLQRHHAQNHAEHGPASDPTRGQGRVLAILKLQPEIPTRDLSYLLGIRQQSLNELLNKLEKAGFVVREPSQEDRRVMVVKLTDRGKNEQKPPRTDFSHIFTCLSEDEMKTFGEYLDRIITALEAQLTAEDREQIDRWMHAARSKMGNEMFERLMSARGGPHRRGDPHFRGGWWDDQRFSHGHNHGFKGHGPDSRSPAPEDMPGGERFDPDYDGPMPHGREPHPFGDGRQTPPEPPQHPDSDDE